MDRTPSCCSQPVAAAAAVYNYGVAGATIGGYASSYDGRPLSTSSSTAIGGVKTVVDDGQGCFCCDSDDDSVERARVAHAKRKCYKSCLRNAFVCALLVSYTFAGALIFLSIEGDVDAVDAVDVDDGAGGSPVREAGLLPSQPQNLTAAWMAAAAAGEESRARTVETIWEITVNLNILYRENWTRLAAQELNRFQEDLIRRLTQQMEIQSAAVSYHAGVGGGFIVDHGGDSDDNTFEWNIATSFLYCLSILTTIGKS
ncbi:Potassium channel subfamily K member 18 [Aphis craccivora]|uniref:Potassium channel subfamily K member 18 n=1 Tax=Aphis craccivora TaxID=307492 RepID=A0A6G0YZQ8_APHCR|nr:Potassium channel subfamily K member 18 [Aphis craccivora]